MPGQDYFSHNYREARAAFLAACRDRRIDTVTRVHPTAQGPDGRLFLDVAALGPRDAERALLLISGTHGVEGYFGSAVQTGLLHEGIAAPEGTRILFVHALNPFGFAWNRRVNEDNVDVNRNFVERAIPNPDYAALADAIAPDEISPEALAAADAKLAAYAATHGPAALQRAVSCGQYSFPDGLFYGGAGESWSASMLKAVVAEDLARVRKLVAIDFHTGLGEPGSVEAITGAPAGSPAHARAHAIWGEHLRSAAADRTSGDGSASAPLTGAIEEGLGRMLAGVDLTFAALEVGTLPLAPIFAALRNDNWLHRHGGAAHLRAPEIERACRDAFYPDTPAWKRAVWAHGRDAARRALASL